MSKASGDEDRHRRKSRAPADPIQALAKTILKKYTDRLQEEVQAIHEMHDPKEGLWETLPLILQDTDAPQTFGKLIPTLRKSATHKKLDKDDIANLRSGHAFLSELVLADDVLLKNVQRESLDAYVTLIRRTHPQMSPSEINEKAAAMQQAATENRREIQQRVGDNRDITDMLAQMITHLDRNPPGRPR